MSIIDNSNDYIKKYYYMHSKKLTTDLEEYFKNFITHDGEYVINLPFYDFNMIKVNNMVDALVIYLINCNYLFK